MVSILWDWVLQILLLYWSKVLSLIMICIIDKIAAILCNQLQHNGHKG